MIQDLKSVKLLLYSKECGFKSVGMRKRKVFKSKLSETVMKTGKKYTGSRYHKSRKKKKYELDRQPRIVKLGKEKRKKLRIRGGKFKVVLLSANICNLMNKKTKKSEKIKIKNVLETPSNRFLARQNILMKSAIIETEKGRARITNRPSQEGSVQAELLDETEGR